MTPPLDATDLRILEALQLDATLTLADLSAQVFLSTGAAWRRLKQLEADGLILRRVAILDAVRLGYPVIAWLDIRLRSADAAHVTDAERALLDIEEAVQVTALAGDTAYLVKLRVGDLAALDAVITHIRHVLLPASLDCKIGLRELRPLESLPPLRAGKSGKTRA